MVLDEPTNDLDIDTLDLLEDMLSEYDGTLLLVSHDRDFLDRLVTGVIAVEENGKVDEYVGGYADYRKQRPSSIEATRPATPAKPKTVTPKQERLSYRDKTDLELLPSRIASIEKKITRLETQLSDSDFIQNDRIGFGKAAAQLEAARKEKEEAEERWLEIEIKRETLAS